MLKMYSIIISVMCHITMAVFPSKWCGNVMRYLYIRFLLPPWYNGGEIYFVCSAYSSGKLHFEFSTVTSLTRNNVLVTLDNSQTLKQTVFTGTTFYRSNIKNGEMCGLSRVTGHQSNSELLSHFWVWWSVFLLLAL